MEYIPHNSGDELTHWGIKGMKWGVRRYQNKDGSLTAAGKKRRARLEGELEKLGGKKSDSDSVSSSSKKSINEMSNKELQEYTTRMQLEKNYYDAQNNLANSVPKKQVSKGKQMAEKFFSDSIMPAIGNTAKTYLESYLKKTLGIDTEDELAKLKKTYEVLKYKTDIDKMENPEKYMSEEDKNKRQQREFNAEDQAAKREGYKDVVERASKIKQKEEADKAKAEDDKAKAEAAASAEKERLLKARKEAQLRSATDKTLSTFIDRTVGQPEPRAAANDERKSVRVDSGEYDFSNTPAKVSSGKDFVDSHGTVMFTVPDSTRDSGKSFVDARGNVLFSWSDDD